MSSSNFHFARFRSLPLPVPPPTPILGLPPTPMLGQAHVHPQCTLLENGSKHLVRSTALNGPHEGPFAVCGIQKTRKQLRIPLAPRSGQGRPIRTFSLRRLVGMGFVGYFLCLFPRLQLQLFLERQLKLPHPRPRHPQLLIRPRPRRTRRLAHPR